MPTRLVAPARSAAVFTLRVQPRWSASSAQRWGLSPAAKILRLAPRSRRPRSLVCQARQTCRCTAGAKNDTISVAGAGCPEGRAVASSPTRRAGPSRYRRADRAGTEAGRGAVAHRGLGRRLSRGWRLRGLREHYIVDAATRQATVLSIRGSLRAAPDGHLTRSAASGDDQVRRTACCYRSTVC